MQKLDYLLIAISLIILGAIVMVAPHAELVASEVSAEVYGVDILGLTKNAGHLPEEQFAGF